MGKNRKTFLKTKGKKRTKSSSDKFKKKRKPNSSLQNDRTVNKTEPEQKRVIKREKFINEDSEDENPFDQLVNSLSGHKSNSKCISSSDSECESELENQSRQDEIQESDEPSGDEESDDSASIVAEDLDKDALPDPFETHFQRDLSDRFYDILSTSSSKSSSIEETAFNFPVLGKCSFIRHNLVTNEINNGLKIDLSGENEKLHAVPGDLPSVMTNVNFNNLCVKSQIQDNIVKANSENLKANCEPSDRILTPLQKDLFSVINNYQDLYYPERTFDNSEEIRFIYSLHAINHALKTRLKIIHHNSRITDKNDVPDIFRDQGLVRPKVLVILPFRESAFRVVNNMISILLSSDDKANVTNKKRFFNEFTGGEIAMPRKKPKPIDYETLFKGNADDNFRIGISVTKKSLKLYADFYSSDIIVASPLGLRLIIGAAGESTRDFDFLASIEVLILDQTEIFLMQNWDHLLHFFEHLHCQPQKPHGTDFSRVRNWALNGWTRYYRQTIVFSSFPLLLIKALFVKNCNNYAGRLVVSNPVVFGSICQVAFKVPQVFCRVDCASSLASVDNRFTYFINEILPQMQDPFMKYTMIYVPSYLDYVMIRNYFKKETVGFVQICEYSKDNKISRARDMFFHGRAHFLLYSERFHFFRRINIKGIRHIVFYQPPTFSRFYSEICNFIVDDKNTNISVTTMYTKYDLPQLSAIVGTERANRILMSNNGIHRIVAE